MFVSQTALAVALAAVTGVLGFQPASAAPISGGYNCRYTNVTGDTPIVLTGGPVYAVNVPAGPGTDVVVTCTVHHSNDVSSSVVASKSSQPGIGATILLPTPVTVTPGPIYVCTKLTWTDPVEGAQVVYFDDDLATAGIQCAFFDGSLVDMLNGGH